MDSMALSRTKTLLPTLRPEIMSRERLLENLYDLLDKKLILVSAPAGYGKTSLLIDLANHAEMPVCWLSLDALDQEPQRFIAYFIAALAQRFPHFGNQSNILLNSLTSLDQGRENLIITLTNEIYEQIGEHFALVLDDYQFVDGVPEIRDFINRFVQLVHENCHLILSSRIVPTLIDLPVMVAREQVGGLSFHELAFQPAEICDLFSKNYNVILSEETAQEYAEKTEGWITGLQLSGLVSSNKIPEYVHTARIANVDLFDYLSQQVLEQQPAELRQFLLETSLLDEFDAELCASVLDSSKSKRISHWKRLIESIKRNNLFVLPVGPEGRWLRYHHLFQDFLKARIKEEQPDKAEEVLRQLAQIHTKNGGWEKAYYVYQQLGDTAALADLVEQAGTPLIQDDRIITLGNWLDSLPDTLIHERPGLLSLRGFIDLLKGNLRYGLTLLGQACEIYRAEDDLPNLALALVRKALAHRLLGDYLSSLSITDEALRITTENEELKNLHAEALRTKGLSLYRLGQIQPAIEWLERSLGLFDELHRTRNVAVLQTELGMAYHAIGKHQIAKSYYKEALGTFKKMGDLTWLANLLNNLGVLHHAQGEYEQAVCVFEEGLQCAQRSGYAHTEALILTSLGDLYFEVGELETAQISFSEAEEIARRIADQFLINYTVMSQANVALGFQNAERSRALLDEIRISVENSNSCYEQGLYHFAYGRLCLSQQEVKQASQHLQTAVDQFASSDRVIEAGLSRLWLAAAFNQSNNEESAREQLQEVFQIAKVGLISHPFNVEYLKVHNYLQDLSSDQEIGAAITRMIQQAEQLRAEFPALRRRLRRLTSRVSDAPPHLSVQVLGKAHVKINGKMIPNSEWQTQSVRELFFYFLHMSQPVTKEQVGLVFWPDVTPAQLKLRFKNNLYRLRRAVGQDAILFDGDVYRFNRELDYEYDVETFKTELKLARAASNSQEKIMHYKMSVGLVRGRYLEDFDATWVLSEREQLEQEYLSALMNLARALKECDMKSEALQVCQQAIKCDACLEEAYQIAMQICAAMKNRAAVAQHYQACQKALENELSVPPSPETEHLYQRLMV